MLFEQRRGVRVRTRELRLAYGGVSDAIRGSNLYSLSFLFALVKCFFYFLMKKKEM